jgi:hypothetical protein
VTLNEAPGLGLTLSGERIEKIWYSIHLRHSGIKDEAK